MHDDEFHRIEESVRCAVEGMLLRSLPKRAKWLVEKPTLSDEQSKVTALKKQLGLVSLLFARNRNLADGPIKDAIECAAADNDHEFFQTFAEILRDCPIPKADKMDSFLCLNWLERTPVRLERGRVLVNLRANSWRRPSAGNPNPGLCQFTKRAIAMYYAAIRLKKTQSVELKSAADNLTDALEKRIERLGLLPAAKKLVRGVKVVSGKIVLEVVAQNTASGTG